jgi:glycosyltransferase involved in cell wall biosynthesis
MISVIIPVYNTASYLDECVGSILRQVYTDFELIIVDDGSTDKSSEICDSWAARDKRIIVIHQPNQGVSAARNHGIDQARGEYICFIDSDDRVDADYLTDLVSGFQKHPNVGLVVSGLARQYDDGCLVYEQPIEEKSIQLGGKDADVFVDNITSFYGPTSKLYRMDVIRENNICFPVEYSLGEDLLFNFNYLKCISVILLLPVAHYIYNIQQSGSLMTTYRDNRFYLDICLWNTQREYLIEKDMWCDSAQEYMSQQLWGITYNGIFNKKNVSLPYLKDILKKADTDILMIGVSSFAASKWIKTTIINKRYFLFYLVRKAMSLFKK